MNIAGSVTIDMRLERDIAELDWLEDKETVGQRKEGYMEGGSRSGMGSGGTNAMGRESRSSRVQTPDAIFMEKLLSGEREASGGL